MAKEDVVKFYEEHVNNDAGLKAQLDDALGREAYIKLAMAEAGKHGLSFTQDEMVEVMDATEAQLSTQLSDNQLDGVVGGTGPTAPKLGVKVKTLPTLKTPTGLAPNIPNPKDLGASTIMCCW